ncbi:D-alanyl-D-alanine carboxypeptidase family protein [Phosphitispora fastidiosa]|uniref:D-alanyl-D-alanine carboxypeptidase family protein n=1 Tax=Phosphitispora fastidiosa TaxID=2837202 RepID=UPI001E30891C|nr:D-alanyl-D-alanine carboxypeptidase family protein [Phosphitispora fastidiosa]MBU7005575.1 D-alanyl-D-alanine carboxypeptidase (penicillin-binding protein 5/6) [Phosphitispora fastidiosa]
MANPQKIIIMILVVILFFGIAPAAPAAEFTGISADAAILMDAGTGQVLFAKEPFKKRPPASTTKVLTALTAIETGSLKDMVEVSEKAAGTEGSSIYLSAGETLTLSDLLYGALMRSGNDACVAIAEYVAGSVERFAQLLNIRALAMGTLNTHFTNPHGLPDEEHYTCAYDLALIARHALGNEKFSEIVETRDKVIDWPGQEWDRRLHNTNKLLWSYLWADGVKTGTTDAAGKCLIASASKDNRRLIAVVLHSGDRWGDCIRLFEYGFNQYEYSQVAVAGEQYRMLQVQNGAAEDVPVLYEADLGILIPSDDSGALEIKPEIRAYPSAPLKKGEVIGFVSYYINDCYTGKVKLIAGCEVKKQKPWHSLTRWLKSSLT